MQIPTTLIYLGTSQYPEMNHKHPVLGSIVFSNAISKTRAQRINIFCGAHMSKEGTWSFRFSKELWLNSFVNKNQTKILNYPREAKNIISIRKMFQPNTWIALVKKRLNSKYNDS